MNPTDTLSKHTFTIHDERRQFAADFPYDWVVMDNDEIFGAYNSHEEAMDAASMRFGNVPMLTVKVDQQPWVVRPAFFNSKGNPYRPTDFPPFFSPHTVINADD
jgi:hypothetical protein